MRWGERETEREKERERLREREREREREDILQNRNIYYHKLLSKYNVDQFIQIIIIKKTRVSEIFDEQQNCLIFWLHQYSSICMTFNVEAFDHSVSYKIYAVP